MSDHRFAEVLAAARAGKADGLGALLDEERSDLMREARRRLPSHLVWAAGASDLVQETFVRARRYFGTFRGQSRGEWRAWLKAILRNRTETRAQSAAREQARVTSLDQNQNGHAARAQPTDPHPTPRTALVTKEQAERILEAIERLPEHYRWVVTMRMFEGLEYAEIAERMQDDATAESVRKIWGRAIIALKKMTGAEDDSG
jgi:RNA polymerase sigma-70 factor (ECF subfamily)